MKHTLIELLQNYFPQAPEEQACKQYEFSKVNLMGLKECHEI